LYAQEGRPNKIGLPAYPFKTERHWYDSYSSMASADSTVLLDALPGKEVEVVSVPEVSDRREVDVTKVDNFWDTSSFDFLEDHEVGDEVRFNVMDDGIGIVQLNASGTKNMLDQQMVNSLNKVFLGLRSRKDLKVVVLTGCGNIFSMGGSQEGLEDIANAKNRFSDAPFMFRGLLEFDVPVISAIQGHAFGGGLLFGLYADVVVMHEDSTYTANFMKYGFTPGMGATYVLQEKLGKQLGTEMMYTARLLSGAQLRSRGASVIVTNSVIKEAMQIAKELSVKPRRSLEVLKENLSGHILNDLLVRIAEEEEMHEKTFHTSETKKRIDEHFESLASVSTGGKRGGRNGLSQATVGVQLSDLPEAKTEINTE